MNYYLEVLREYTEFNGRVRGKKFWYFFLINCIVVAILEVLGTMLSGGNPNGTAATGLTGIYTLAVLLPYIGVTIRRLHDTNKSGWLTLLILIPVVGGLIVLVLCAAPGTVGPNQYGPDPVDTAGIEATA